MTDKVQKIREEVARLMYGFNLEADIASCEDAEAEKLANIKYQLCKKILEYIDSLQEEPVSEDLEKAVNDAMPHRYCWSGDGEPVYTKEQMKEFFKAGAKWQFSQLEKNRLAACDKQTEEEAEIEQSFVMGIIEKEHRQPTFDDAIKYGMRLQKEQMMANAANVEVKVDAGGYPYIPQMELYDYNKDIPLAKEGDKYKVILIK